MGSGLGGPWGITRGSARGLRAARPGAGGRAGRNEAGRHGAERAGAQPGRGRSEGGGGEMAAGPARRGEPRCGTAGAGPAGAARPAAAPSRPCGDELQPRAEAGADRPPQLPAGPEWCASPSRVPRQPGFLTEPDAAPPPPSCCPWRWSPEYAAVGLGLAVGVSGALPTPGALRSCCAPWPAACGLCGCPQPGHRSILPPTSINGCNCSMSCRTDGWHGAFWGWQPRATLAASHHGCGEPGSQMRFQASRKHQEKEKTLGEALSLFLEGSL